MLRPTKKDKWVGTVKPKAKALGHFKIEAVFKLDDWVSALSLSWSGHRPLIFQSYAFD